jgi:hypothetical protein
VYVTFFISLLLTDTKQTVPRFSPDHIIGELNNDDYTNQFDTSFMGQSHPGPNPSITLAAPVLTSPDPPIASTEMSTIAPFAGSSLTGTPDFSFGHGGPFAPGSDSDAVAHTFAPLFFPSSGPPIAQPEGPTFAVLFPPFFPNSAPPTAQPKGSTFLAPFTSSDPSTQSSPHFNRPAPFLALANSSLTSPDPGP